MSTQRSAAVESLRHLIVAGDQYRHAAAAHLGLGVTDTHAISHLHEAGPMSQGQLGDRLGLTSGGAVGLVDRLERAGIVRRDADPEDRRRHQLVLTPAGEQILVDSGNHLALAFEGIADHDLPGVSELLDTVAVQLLREAVALRRTPVVPIRGK